MPFEQPHYAITKLPDGGFLVEGGFNHAGYARQLMFASTTIEEALAFIKKKMKEGLSK